MKEIIKKISNLIDKSDRGKLVILFIMMFFGGVLETLGVSMIIPIATLLLQKDIMEKNRYLGWFSTTFHIVNSTQLIFVFIGVMIFLFVFKSMYLLVEYYYISKFISSRKLAVQVRLLDSYLARPYEYYLDASTSEILRNISSDVGGAFEIISDILQMLIEAVTGVLLVITIFVTAPQMAAAVTTILLLLVFFITVILKPKMKRLGTEGMHAAQMCSKWLLQALDGMKDLIVSGKKDFFREQYRKYGNHRVRCERNNSVLSKVPKLMIESLSIVGILIGLAVVISMGMSVESILPQMSGFAVAAVKLIPGVNRISTYLNDIAYKEPMLDQVLLNIKEADSYRYVSENGEVSGLIKAKETITLRDISYSYPNTSALVLENISKQFQVGTSIGFIGASGAGKSTLVDIILGLLRPGTGEVLADGVGISANISSWQRSIGYIPQMIFMLDASIESNIAFGLAEEEIDKERIQEVLKEVQLDEFVKNLPEGVDTIIGEKGVRISGGQRQRIGIARALYPNPDILVLDEATSALDSETERAIMEAIEQLHGKKTMFIIAHRLQTIRNCDKIYKVENGKLWDVDKSELNYR